jgi:hypothetical protein
MVIHPFGGNVGIGTANPGAELEVNGEIRISSDSESKLKIGRYSATSPSSYISTTSDAEQMRLQIADSTKMVIDTSGKIGIGTLTPGGKLDVQNSSETISAQIINSSSSGNVYGVNVLATGAGGTNHYAGRFQASGATENFAIYADGAGSKSYFSGNVGIGTTSPSSKLHVSGGCITGSMCSDIRLKKNIEPLPYGSILDRVMGLEAVTFEWKDRVDGKRQIGLIAQDVEEVFPEVVTTPDDGTCEKGLLATGVDAVLVEAIKELKIENELLKDRIEALEGIIEKHIFAVAKEVQ